MISAGDFRNGVTFEMDGQVVSIIEFINKGTLQVIQILFRSFRPSKDYHGLQ